MEITPSVHPLAKILESKPSKRPPDAPAASGDRKRQVKGDPFRTASPALHCCDVRRRGWSLPQPKAPCLLGSWGFALCLYLHLVTAMPPHCALLLLFPQPLCCSAFKLQSQCPGEGEVTCVKSPGHPHHAAHGWFWIYGQATPAWACAFYAVAAECARTCLGGWWSLEPCQGNTSLNRKRQGLDNPSCQLI